jgi:hypothetical protein
MGIRRDYPWEFSDGDMDVPAYPPRPKQIDPVVDRLIKHADSKWYSFRQRESEEENMMPPPPPCECIPVRPYKPIPTINNDVADLPVVDTPGYSHRNLSILHELTRRITAESTFLGSLDMKNVTDTYRMKYCAAILSNTKMMSILTNAIREQMKADLDKVATIETLIYQEPTPSDGEGEEGGDDGPDSQFVDQGTVETPPSPAVEDDF